MSWCPEAVHPLMSEAERDPIDLRAVLARIDRDLAEMFKLLAETRKSNR